MTLSQRTRESWLSVRVTSLHWPARSMKTGSRVHCMAGLATSPATMWRWWYHFITESPLTTEMRDGKDERKRGRVTVVMWWRGKIEQQKLETWNSEWIQTTSWERKILFFSVQFFLCSMSLQSNCHWRWVSKTLSRFLALPSWWTDWAKGIYILYFLYI